MVFFLEQYLKTINTNFTYVKLKFEIIYNRFASLLLYVLITNGVDDIFYCYSKFYL